MIDLPVLISTHTEMVDSTNVKQKFSQKIRSLKFPITIEPLVCLYTISVGLNEVILLGLLQTEESFNTIHIANSKPRLNERSDKMEPGIIKEENINLIISRLSDLISSLTKSVKTNWTWQLRSALSWTCPTTRSSSWRCSNMSRTTRRSTAQYHLLPSKSQCAEC